MAPEVYPVHVRYTYVNLQIYINKFTSLRAKLLTFND